MKLHVLEVTKTFIIVTRA